MNTSGAGKSGLSAIDPGLAAGFGLELARSIASKLVVCSFLLGSETDGCLDSSGSFLEVNRNGTDPYSGPRAGRSLGTLESIPR